MLAPRVLVPRLLASQLRDAHETEDFDSGRASFLTFRRPIYNRLLLNVGKWNVIVWWDTEHLIF